MSHVGGRLSWWSGDASQTQSLKGLCSEPKIILGKALLLCLDLQERQKKDRKDISRSESSDENLIAADATSGPQQVRSQTKKVEPIVIKKISS